MGGPQQQPSQSPFAVNGGMLGAVVFGWGAFALWPTTPEWWGLGVVSVMLGLGAAGCLASAIGAVIGRYRRDLEIHRYLSQGSGPKSAGLASKDELRRAGMIE